MTPVYRNIAFSIACAILIIALMLSYSKPADGNDISLITYDASNTIEGELIVMLQEGKSINKFISDHKNLGLSVKRPIFKDYNIWLLGYDETSASPEDALLPMLRSNDVSIAQFNRKISLRSPSAPNDVEFEDQWNLNNTGQNGGTPDADIDAPEAWSISTGGQTLYGDEVVIAVIDDGFFLNHSDLNFWKNTEEIPDNNIDDDLNGYIDDYSGWNVYTGSGNITTRDHGTRVSGIAGALGNNRVGISGVGWKLKIMPVQSSVDEASILEAYGYIITQRKIYNRTMGAKGSFVVATNSSFGIDYGNPSNFPLWCAFYDSLGKAGILSVAATINANVNVDSVGDVPTACSSEFLVTVTSTTKNDTKSGGAGFGPTTIDLSAPGTRILSTDLSNYYSKATGTSMASPHVAGSIGLMYTAADNYYLYYGRQHPDSLALLFKKYILESVDTLQSLNGLLLTDGRLNLYKALLKADSPPPGSLEPPVIPNEYSLLQNYPNPFNPVTNIVYDIPQSGHVKLLVYDITGKLVLQPVNQFQETGRYNYIFSANGLASGIYIYRLESNNFITEKKMVLLK